MQCSKELNVEKVECGMHQGDKVGASVVGELSRIKDKVKLHSHSSFFAFCHADVETTLIMLIFTQGNNY